MIVRIRGPKGTERLQLEDGCSVETLIGKALEKYAEDGNKVSRKLCFDPAGEKNLIESSSGGSLKDVGISHGDMLYVVEIGEEEEDHLQPEIATDNTAEGGNKEKEEVASVFSTSLKDYERLPSSPPSSSLAESEPNIESGGSFPMCAEDYDYGSAMGSSSAARHSSPDQPGLENIIPPDVLKALQGSDEGIPNDLLDQVQGTGQSSATPEIPPELMEQFHEEDRKAAGNEVRPADDRYTDRLIGSPEGHDMEDVWEDAADPISLMHHAFGPLMGRAATGAGVPQPSLGDPFPMAGRGGAFQQHGEFQDPSHAGSTSLRRHRSFQDMQLEEDEELAKALAISMGDTEEDVGGNPLGRMAHNTGRSTSAPRSYQDYSPERGIQERNALVEEDAEMARVMQESLAAAGSSRHSRVGGGNSYHERATHIGLSDQRDRHQTHHSEHLAGLEDEALARVMQLSMEEENTTRANQPGKTSHSRPEPRRPPPQVPQEKRGSTCRQDSDNMRLAEISAKRLAALDAMEIPTTDFDIEYQLVEHLAPSQIRNQLREMGISTLHMKEKPEFVERLAQERVNMALKFEGNLLEIQQMRSSQIKTELKQRGYPTADIFEKEELVHRLAKARTKHSLRPKSSRATGRRHSGESSRKASNIPRSHTRPSVKEHHRNPSDHQTKIRHPVEYHEQSPFSYGASDQNERARKEMSIKSSKRAKELLDEKYGNILDQQDKKLEKIYKRNVDSLGFDLGHGTEPTRSRYGHSSRRPSYPPSEYLAHEQQTTVPGNLEADIENILNRNGSSLSTHDGHQRSAGTETPPYEAINSGVDMETAFDENDATIQAVLLASLQAQADDGLKDDTEEEELRRALAISVVEHKTG